MASDNKTDTFWAPPVVRPDWTLEQALWECGRMTLDRLYGARDVGLGDEVSHLTHLEE